MIFIIGCKKYEEGPTISLATKQSRLINTWILERMYINNIEQTLCPEDRESYLEIKKRGKCTYTLVKNGQATSYTGIWDLDNKKKYLTIMTVMFLCGKPFYNAPTFKILRLKNDELRLEKEENGKTYKLYYVTKK